MAPAQEKKSKKASTPAATTTSSTSSKKKEVVKAVDIAPAVYKPAVAEKEDDLSYDLGNLAAFDEHPVDVQAFNKNKEAYLLSVARDNAQLLINKIFELPVENSEVGPLATLPADVTPLPRARPVPKPKVETRWEKFAREKGIKKTKKSRKVFDEQKQEWSHSWGYQRANDDTQDWLMEHRTGQDKFADPWTEKKQEKRARVEKNERQRANNAAQGRGRQSSSLPTGIPVDLISSEKKGKSGTKKTLQNVQVSTASMGKFDSQRPGEPERKKSGVKRKFDSVTGNADSEKTKFSSVINHIISKDSNKRPSNEVNVHADPTDSRKRKKGKGSGRSTMKVTIKAAKKANRRGKK